MEVWKKINNFNNYSISNAGKIRNDKTNRILKPYIKPSGYMQVQLGRKTVPQYIHRLVAIAFIPTIKNKPQVNHKNGNKQDNRVINLEWVNASENRKKKIVATNKDGREIIFNSRDETATYFNCDKSKISYGRYYKKGNKKNWIFKLKI